MMDKFEASFIVLFAIVITSLTVFLSAFFLTQLGSAREHPNTMASSSQREPSAGGGGGGAAPSPDGPERRNVLGKLKLKDLFRRNRQRAQDEEGDAVVHPPVFCVEDLEVPPPTYQRARCDTPSSLEMSTLREQLGTLKEMRVAAFEPFEKTLHKAEIVNLHLWIKQLEGLVQKKAVRAAAAAPPADSQTAASLPDTRP
ncbi:hypothetical protein ESCO_002320 [Escovopsis weberi]|uniref:Uncharacterized protein n=1 Tax=Escovopsis weberi TaxID=150374 RepID=A0A0M8MYQ9_ESCWE|nr:hypothetical protein ESCO_002320 [Escovopsis weberi]